jgi:Skp family chaperone for outer membrane proteins
MVASSRGIFAIGLCLAGVAYLVAPTLGQNAQQDGSVRKTTSPTPTTPPTPIAPVVGTIDIELVFKSYDKVKVSNKEYNAALMARKNELMRIMSEAQEEAQLLSKFAPGTDDYKKHENRVTELKARHEAGREQAEREFAQRQAEAMGTLYKEIQEMVKNVARWRKMNYIVRISNQPIMGSDPNSVMAAISSTLVYADNRNDITNDVIYNLNRFYKASASPSIKPTGSAATPSGNEGRLNGTLNGTVTPLGPGAAPGAGRVVNPAPVQGSGN